MRGRSFLPVALLSGLLVFVLGCGKSAPEPLYIGHVAPRGLAERNIGDSADHGILMAVEEVKDDPPIAGRVVTVLNPETRGVESFPPVAPRATGAELPASEGPVPGSDSFSSVATRLITLNRVAALLADTPAAATERLCRIVQQGSPFTQQGVPLIASSGLPGSALAPFGFSVGIAPAEQGKYLARYAAQELKTKHVDLVVNSQLLISQPLTIGFAAEFEKTEGSKLERHVFADAKKLAALVEKLQLEEGGLVVCVGTEEDLATLTADKKMEGRPILFGGEERIKPTADPNVMYPTAYFSDGGTPRAQEFEKKYRARFGQAPDVTAGLAHDGARVLFEGLRKAKSVRGEKIRDELRELKKFESLTGPLSFDKDNNTRRPVFIVRRDKNGVTLLKRYDPEEK
jgi:branched-chain amino acid transport system substrate-binding protein